MNTPAHAAFSLILLGRAERHALPVALGAVAPDLSMLAFYAWERLVRGVPEPLIWSDRYYDPAWQVAFDIPHSIPILALALLGFIIAARRSSSASDSILAGRPPRFLKTRLFLGSMLIHAVADLPLHREDAHAHFFPITDWKFVSPISYWDPDHFGLYAGAGEIMLVLGVSAFLLRRYRGRGRWILWIIGGAYVLFALFAVLTWSGLGG